MRRNSRPGPTPTGTVRCDLRPYCTLVKAYALKGFEMLKYTSDHEWLEIEGDIATVGITALASEKFGDLVYIQMPEVGARFAKGDELIVVESVKAASEVCCPLDGEIMEINDAIVVDPSLVRSDPEGAAWFFKLKLLNPPAASELLDKATYASLTA